MAGGKYREDQAHVSTDQGVFVLGVRKDTAATTGGADGDYVGLISNSSGQLHTTGGGMSDAIFVDDAAYTMGSSKGVMIMGLAGTNTVNANDAAALSCDTSGHLNVNASLSATDNAVLDTIDAVLDNILTKNTEIDTAIDTMDAVIDAILVKNTEIDAVLDTIKVDTEAIETAVEGGATALHNTTADIFTAHVAAQTGNHTRTVVKSGGAAGKSIYITDILWSTDGVTLFTLHDESDAQVVVPVKSAASGLASHTFKTPIKMAANEDLELTTVTVSSASHAVTVSGYLK